MSLLVISLRGITIAMARNIWLSISIVKKMKMKKKTGKMMERFKREERVRTGRTRERRRTI